MSQCPSVPVSHLPAYLTAPSLINGGQIQTPLEDCLCLPNNSPRKLPFPKVFSTLARSSPLAMINSGSFIQTSLNGLIHGWPTNRSKNISAFHQGIAQPIQQTNQPENQWTVCFTCSVQQDHIWKVTYTVLERLSGANTGYTWSGSLTMIYPQKLLVSSINMHIAQHNIYDLYVIVFASFRTHLTNYNDITD